jgi:hypothetical protein
MNIKTLEAFHFVLVQLLDSSVLATGFGFSYEDLNNMKQEVEELIEEEKYYVEANTKFPINCSVNTQEMHRTGYTGRVVRSKTEGNGTTALEIEWKAIRPHEKFYCWVFPHPDGSYWWGDYPIRRV